MAYNVLVKTISGGIQQFRASDAVDIAIITVLIYHLILLTKETRAFQVLKGIGIVFIAALVSDVLQLVTISWLLNSLLSVGIILAVVLFQPELRRALEHIGRGNLFSREFFGSIIDNGSEDTVREMHQAITDLAKRRVGALIVIEQRTGLGDIINTGTLIEGRISAPLIENIFEPNTPLHDGAMIVRAGRVCAAGCVLPLSNNLDLGKDMGTRHRACLGIAENSDAIAIVVSEETGIISMAKNGVLIRHFDRQTLYTRLIDEMIPKEPTVEKSTADTWKDRAKSLMKWVSQKGEDEQQ